jgi:glc operon protein GlcG
MRTNKPALTSADVQQMMAACIEEANRNQWKVTIAIVDEGGYLLQLQRLDGAVLQSPEIAILKARTSAITRTPTKLLEDIAKDRPGTLTFPGRLPVQGGVPLIYEGECVGAIGVSGVKSFEDEQVALAGQKAL